MKNETKDLIEALKQNQEDFEWYPTTNQMFQSVFMNFKHTDAYNNGSFSVLDIGAGRCGLKRMMFRMNLMIH